MPPSVEFVASAWESCGPGLAGSLNGKTVAGAGALGAGVADGAGVAAGLSAGAEPVLGALPLTTGVGLAPSRPLMTKTAGCSFVAPPWGISATAGWRPGAREPGAAPASGRTTLAGAATVRNALSSVPW